jgi:hypothetical protein
MPMIATVLSKACSGKGLHGLGLGPRSDLTRGPGLDLVEQIMFGFVPGLNDSNQILF